MHIYASQVAKATGYNRYEHPSKLLVEMWKRQHPEQYKHAVNSAKRPAGTMDDKFDAIAKTDENIRKIQKTTEQFTGNCLQNQSVDIEKLNDILLSIPEGENKKLVQDFLKHQVNTTFGTKMETSAIKTYEQTNACSVRDNNARYRSRSIGNGVSIGGKHDGIDDSKGLLIEVKNRTSERIFRQEHPPIYDIIQMHCYMYIYDLAQARLVEKYKSEMKQIDIHWNAELWSDITMKLHEFAKKFAGFERSDSNAQQHFIEATEKQQMALYATL